MAAPDDGFVEVALRVAFRMRIVDAARVVERDIQVIPPPLGRERDRHIADAVLPRLSRLRRRSLVLVPETLLAQTPVDELPRGRTTTAPALAPGDLRPDQWLSLAPSTAAGLARVDGAAAGFTLDEVSAHRSVSPRLGQRPQREADPLPRSNTPAEDGFFAAAERGDRDGVLVALGADVPVAARSAKHGGSALHLAAVRHDGGALLPRFRAVNVDCPLQQRVLRGWVKKSWMSNNARRSIRTQAHKYSPPAPSTSARCGSAL